MPTQPKKTDLTLTTLRPLLARMSLPGQVVTQDGPQFTGK